MLARQIVGGAPSNPNGWSGKYESFSQRGLGGDKAVQGAQPPPAAQSVDPSLHFASRGNPWGTAGDRKCQSRGNHEGGGPAVWSMGTG